MYVAFVSYRCCKSRSKDVAYIAIVSEACCKRMFRVMFQRYVSFVFFGCMLQLCFFLDVAYVSHIHCTCNVFFYYV
jgi:hypothetical protein